jgi:hypothetical protein
MVLDLLMGNMPRYRVADRFLETAGPLLLGDGRVAADVTDDSRGRALDTWAAATPKAVLTAVVAPASAREHVQLRSLHWDSTSQSLSGGYPDVEEETGDSPPATAEDAATLRPAPPLYPNGAIPTIIVLTSNHWCSVCSSTGMGPFVWGPSMPGTRPIKR